MPDRIVVDRTEPAAAAAEQSRKWGEVGRLSRVLTRLIEDNHLSPRIAELYRDNRP